MPADDQPTPEPKADAAEPVAPAAGRLEPTAERPPAGARCVACGYELVGLDLAGVCPECGRDVAASWPAMDLRACHRAIIAQDVDELGALFWAAFWIGFGAMAGAAALLLDPLIDGLAAEGYARGLISGGVLPGVLFGVGGLVLAARRMRRHANDHLAPGASMRGRVRASVYLLAAGAAIPLAIAAAVREAFQPLGIALAVVALVAGVLGVGIACAATFDYASHILDRAGYEASQSNDAAVDAVVWIGYTAAFASALGGYTPWWWLAVPWLVAIMLTAARATRRCGRALRVLKGLLSQPD